MQHITESRPNNVFLFFYSFHAYLGEGQQHDGCGEKDVDHGDGEDPDVDLVEGGLGQELHLLLRRGAKKKKKTRKAEEAAGGCHTTETQELHLSPAQGRDTSKEKAAELCQTTAT